jgi:hypothetical protein
MIKNFYLDESGNSGDLINAGLSFGFGDQPVFVLSCIGVDDLDELDREVTRLKKAHKVLSKELKSVAVKGKPRFIEDVVSYLGEKNLPIFIEVVEKRFFICATIVDRMVLPPIGVGGLDAQELWIKNIFAEHLSTRMHASVMKTYLDACATCTNESARHAYGSLLGWIDSSSPDDEIVKGIGRFVRDSYADFETLAKRTADAWQKMLPLPDYGKKEKPFWMLPNLSSFTNIYARINLYLDGKIESAKLFHDEQLQFDHILEDGKIAAEQLSGYADVARHADYTFLERADLGFVCSEGCIGIQIADVLGGFVMRYVQRVLSSGGMTEAPSVDCFRRLLRLSAPERGIGINFVMASRDFTRIGLQAALRGDAKNEFRSVCRDTSYIFCLNGRGTVRFSRFCVA